VDVECLKLDVLKGCASLLEAKNLQMIIEVNENAPYGRNFDQGVVCIT
jgi:hypothetical protein